MELNELNKNANGGTELVTRGLLSRVQPELQKNVQLISSRVRSLDPNKKRILHLHDLPQDPEAQHLSNPESRKNFDKLVFCSNWQYQQYQNFLGVPYSSQSTVISNGIEPLKNRKRVGDKIRLIYTSTPHRGLQILVPVFDFLYKNVTKDIHLDVFSSFNIYGWPERDKPFEPIFEFCRNHPAITYHGFQPNEKVREYLEMADIFAYPSIWQETFCIALAEAMSAGCYCIHSDLGALPETSGGLTYMYSGTTDIQEHTNIFYEHLKTLILEMQGADDARREDMYKYLSFVKDSADIRFGWDSVGVMWNNLYLKLQ